MLPGVQSFSDFNVSFIHVKEMNSSETLITYSEAKNKFPYLFGKMKPTDLQTALSVVSSL